MATDQNTYEDPPALTEFGEFHIHTGEIWDPTTTIVTTARRCVAVAHHAQGWVALADTKHLLGEQNPLFFTGPEWEAFQHALREGLI